MENKYKQFKPFQKVIVKSKIDNKWYCEFYSHYNAEKNWHTVTTGTSIDDEEILPYEGNEHLVGTFDEPEEIELKEGEWIICNDDAKLLMDGIGFLTTFSYVDNDTFYTGKSIFVATDYNYVVKFSDFNPNDMKETRKHILCVKNGKIIKYRK